MVRTTGSKTRKRPARAGAPQRRPVDRTSQGDDELDRALRYLRYFRALAESAKALTSTLELERVLDVIMRSVSHLLGPENWSLMLLDPKANELYFAIAVGAAADRIRHMRLPLGEGVAGWVAEHRQALIVPRAREDERFCARMDQASRFQTGSIACVPLVFADELLGVIELVSHRDAEAYSEEDLAILSPFADFAAIAISNARNFQRAQELTLVDEWTTLYNARYLRRCLADEVQRGYRYHHPVSVAFMDLDHFKAVNDTHGHDVGSALLRAAGETLWRVVRVADRPVRYGGDEFVVVMPETSKPGALMMAERLREAISTTELSTSSGAVARVTVSVGVATFPDDASSADALLSASDRAMYFAKAQGRDLVRDARDLSVSTK